MTAPETAPGARGARGLRIACLAWGSLVWKWAPLVTASAWMEGGPSLPIEFCRVGDGGELATTLLAGAPRVATRWAWLATADLAEACEQLRRREKIDPERTDGVGAVPAGDASLPFAADIRDWARERSLDHVVWTALPPRFGGEERRAPTADEAVAYLEGLTGDVRAHAEHYVRHVPGEIRTPFREAIEARLGWRQTPAGT